MSKKAKEEVIEEVTIPTISEESSELGTIRINHSVIAGIVRLSNTICARSCKCRIRRSG